MFLYIYIHNNTTTDNNNNSIIIIILKHNIAYHNCMTYSSILDYNNLSMACIAGVEDSLLIILWIRQMWPRLNPGVALLAHLQWQIKKTLLLCPKIGYIIYHQNPMDYHSVIQIDPNGIFRVSLYPWQASYHIVVLKRLSHSIRVFVR